MWGTRLLDFTATESDKIFRGDKPRQFEAEVERFGARFFTHHERMM
jgi:hypothetical protein